MLSIESLKMINSHVSYACNAVHLCLVYIEILFWFFHLSNNVIYINIFLWFFHLSNIVIDVKMVFVHIGVKTVFIHISALSISVIITMSVMNLVQFHGLPAFTTLVRVRRRLFLRIAWNVVIGKKT
jgi:hypothetical protein